MTGAPGLPPLGATPDGRGVTFAIYSSEAEKVELCLFDRSGRRETRRHALGQRTGNVWHDWIPNTGPGQLYGYRIHGMYRPAEGRCFNPHKLLIDPYTRGLKGRLVWNDALFGYAVGHPDGTLSFDTRDSAPFVPKCVVTALPRGERPPAPRTSMADSIIYELHAKGMTRRHPEVPKRLRGTLAALADPAIITHLRQLGVTAVELLPVHAWADEQHLHGRGLVNYWGYNTLAFFCPDETHLAAGGIAGFARMVDAFHDAGIEVLLDVVYNHTAEGDATGPTLSFRGIDNRTYYRLSREDPHRYVDYSGCGNTLNAAHPTVARLIVDSLRYWADIGGVDGFRFDLASALTRDTEGGYEGRSPLLDMIAADPMLSRLKLIAEPWDATLDGQRLGTFPESWSEWNDRYRNIVRRYWRGDGDLTGELATRLSGSSDIFGPSDRPPSAGVNFITAHDGFSLHDLVFFTEKRNEANGEDNRDGDNQNFGFGLGENDGDDPALIRRQKRNLLATLLLSRGVSMLRAGDELSHTQNGNNNAYCQDNDISWIDWSALGDANRDLSDFVAALARFRRAHPVLTEDHFLDAPRWTGDSYRVTWLQPDGHEMTDADWHFPGARVLACLLSRDGDYVLAILNGLDAPLDFTLPEAPGGWTPAIDTSLESGVPDGDAEKAAGRISIGPCSVTVFTAQNVLEPLSVRARARGIATGFHDVHGTWHEASDETLALLLDAIGPRPAGTAAPSDPRGVPCYLPSALQAGQRRWGLAVQLYGLRSARNWGIGDFRDLGMLAEMAAASGAAALQVNPLHALFPWWPDHNSPYAPSSRSFLNPLYIAVEDVPGFDDSAEAQDLAARLTDELERLRHGDFVDYPAVARCKTATLETLFRHFKATHVGRGTKPDRAFTAFLADRGETLSDFATFEALGLHFAKDDRGDWHDWPAEYQAPRTPAVERFAQDHEDTVTFRAWLQWVAAEQLNAVGRLARQSMDIGLIADIAIGAAGPGADTWLSGDAVADGVEIGAPPDPFNAHGQAWGAPPWRPDMLRAQDYAPFRAMLRAAMSWAGSIRLDHVIGLQRQFWVPKGGTGRDGAYVAYPLDELLAVVAAESNRYRCLVIGEDLGTVPEGFRERLHETAILSTRVLYFERTGDGVYVSPRDYAYLSSATASTHDLPTLAGYMKARDIDSRAGIGYFADADAEADARATRTRDLEALTAALRQAGFIGDEEPDAAAFRNAVHRFLASTGSALALAQLEDALGVEDQANFPGTTTEMPNWQRRYPSTLEEMSEDGTLRTLAELFARRHPDHGP